jgi:hypothetical protein
VDCIFSAPIVTSLGEKINLSGGIVVYLAGIRVVLVVNEIRPVQD